ncbi:MAG TPA: hypothetical protein VFJ46_08780, partial [Xanthobacteraceae bacterium]|nr:hypothetical protein [Xanthobacteraceae bacterium]
MSSALLALTVVSSDIGAAAAAPFPVNASAFRVPASNDRIDVRFSNRPFRVKRFQTIHHYSVDVAHGL